MYIGGPGFGARHAAGNSVEDIAELVRYARPFGVRVYATMNTLLLDDELDEAEAVARSLIDAGVDALIVQDMAFLRMGLQGVELHASTQVSNIAPEDVAFLGRAGFSRVILERALSLAEIRAIREASAHTGVELEAFVHGAICVGYSGRCFMSKADFRDKHISDENVIRSGNRGTCSQPCRLSYDLTDEVGRILIKGKHLLSVSDLDLSAHIGELLGAGVSSFKIEGRLKDITYIRNIVSYYRRVIDEALARQCGLQRASVGEAVPDFEPSPSKSFTRGGTGDYFFNGAVRGVASFDTPKAIGEAIGFCDKQAPASDKNSFFTLKNASAQLAAGDGICFFAGGELRGTNINRVEGGRVYPNRMDGIAAGAEIFRNYDHNFTRAVERSRTRRRIGVRAQVEVDAESVSVRFMGETGVWVEVLRHGTFEPARDAEKMAAMVREQLSKSGETIFEVREVTVNGVALMRFVPVSMLAEMRREGLARLAAEHEKIVPERRSAVEEMSVKFPRTKITACENVVNRLAERFYRDHGVEEIEPGLELHSSMAGEVVMRSRYCIRRELNACSAISPTEPRQSPQVVQDKAMGVNKYRGDLFLERGGVRYRLGFECAKCEMTITKI